MGLMTNAPAYVALLAEAQVDAGVRHGLPPDKAAEMVVQTFAGTAALLRARGNDTLAVRREVTSPGGSTARGLAALERAGVRAAFQDALDAVLGVRSYDARSSPPRATQIANFVDALLLVYTILIIAYIFTSMYFNVGGRIPYSRWSRSVLDFLRDVTEPYLALFRRFIPPFGPLDLSPMVAIDRAVAGRRHRRQPDPGLSTRTRPRAGRARPGRRRRRSTRSPRRWSAAASTSARRTRSSRRLARPRPQHGRGVRRVRGRRDHRGGAGRRRARRAVVYFFTHLDKPLVWLPTGMLLGGSIGNIIDRVRDGAVTDFVKLPAWPAFNVADISITFGVLVLLWVIEQGPRDGADAADGQHRLTPGSGSTRCSPSRWARGRAPRG